MRDPARIDRICDLLKEQWKYMPDQRLGQFLCNYIFGKRHNKYISYIVFMEDDSLKEDFPFERNFYIDLMGRNHRDSPVYVKFKDLNEIFELIEKLLY